MQKLCKFYLSLIILTYSWSASSAVLPNFVPLIEKYSPAVVNISTTTKVNAPQSRRNQFNEQIPFGQLPDIFEHFFKREFRNQNFQPSASVSSLGSGMIISQDGYILTNHHVVKNATEIIVRLKNRSEYKAKLIGSDKHTDVALIKINATNLPTITVGKAKLLKVGEWVFAIGSPFGFDLSASAGIVSAKGRSVPGESEYNYVPFIQTDVAINPGNSGGPLFNLKGEVVGVNSMIYSRSGGYMGVSFSIPIEVAMNVVKQIREHGSVTRGWLGVLIQPVTHNLAQSFGMKNPEGSLVIEILANSPAANSDIQVGDVILKFNGIAIKNNSDLPPLVAAVAVDKNATVKVLRQGKIKYIKVKIRALPNKFTQAKASDNQVLATAGLSLTEVPDNIRKKIKLQSGGVLVQSVADDSMAEKSGIIAGDVIITFNYHKVRDPQNLYSLIKKLPNNKSVPILLKRGLSSSFLAFRK